MSIYSLNMSNVSRAQGSSTLANLAYISGRKINDEKLGKAYQYSRAQRVMATGTLLPPGAPQEYSDPEVLFNEVEKLEKRQDARPGKKMIIALPREWDLRTQQRAVEEYITNTLTAKGYAATYAIHGDEDNNNPHVHVLIANRPINAKTGKWSAKAKTDYLRDDKGDRIPIIDAETGVQKVDKRNRKQWQRTTVKQWLEQKDALYELRSAWSTNANKYLPDSAHIDHRSYAARGIDQEPTIHEGYAARGIEQRGAWSEICAHNRRIRSGNRLNRRLTEQIAVMTKQIKTQTGEAYGRIIRAFERAIQLTRAAIDLANRAVSTGKRRVEESQCVIDDAKSAVSAISREVERAKSATSSPAQPVDQYTFTSVFHDPQAACNPQPHRDYSRQSPTLPPQRTNDVERDI